MNTLGSLASTAEMSQLIALTRQFWVGKDEVVAQNYDLSASRYRQVEQEEVFYERPTVTLVRLRQLEAVATGEVAALEQMLTSPSPGRTKQA